MSRRKMDYVQPVDPTRQQKVKGPPCRWPGPGETLVLFPAESEVLWYATHFVEGRTRPHLGEICSCWQAEVPVNQRLVGWILAFERSGRLVLAQVTLNALRYCRQLQDSAIDLRTKKLTLRREGTRVNGKVFATVDDRSPTERDFPAVPFDQRAQLMRVWFDASADMSEVNATAAMLDYLGSRDPLVAGDPSFPQDPRKEGA
jgi:hypothetical protein